VAWIKVTSDQSVPFLASAAALTIPIGLPTTWLLINAPNERPSCHPVYGAPWNAATGPPAKPSVTNWSFELKYVFAILPIPFVVSFIAPGNSNAMPWALRLVPPLYENTIRRPESIKPLIMASVCSGVWLAWDVSVPVVMP
jgi:hypothetical protein